LVSDGPDRRGSVTVAISNPVRQIRWNRKKTTTTTTMLAALGRRKDEEAKKEYDYIKDEESCTQ
jgi:hypothetical protein